MQRWAVALVVAMIACGSGEPESGVQSDPAVESAIDSVSARPATLEDTVMVEGMPEPSTATLYTTPSGFALPFSTYVPEGIDVDVTEGDPAGVNFSAAFGGVEQPLAYMHVAPYEAGTDIGTARDRIGGYLRSRLAAGGDPATAENVEDTWQLVDAPAWAVEAYSFDYAWNPDQRFVGRVIMARHGTTLFHLIMHYPPEYGDGFGPRLDAMLEHWRWEDTGRMLRDPS